MLITIPGRDALEKIAAEYQPDENCEDAIEVFELGMEGLKIAIEESRLYIFDPVTDPVRHQSLS